MQKIGFAEALDSIVATDNRYSWEAYVFFGTRLIIPQNSKRKPIKRMAITPVNANSPRVPINCSR